MKFIIEKGERLCTKCGKISPTFITVDEKNSKETPVVFNCPHCINMPDKKRPK